MGDDVHFPKARAMTVDDGLDIPERLAMRLYADVLDGAPLEQALGGLAEALGGETSFATRVFFKADEAIPVGRFSQVGFDPTALADYATHWMPLDPRMEAGAAQPAGVINFGRVLPAEALERSPFWNEFAVRRAPAFHSLAARFEVGAEVTGIVAIQRPLGQDPFGPREEALMTRLYPHLKRALLAELRLADAQAMSTATGMDRLHHGVAVLDARRRLHFVNATLARFLAMRDGLALGAEGPRLCDPAAQRDVDGAIRQSLAVVGGRMRVLPETTGFLVSRPSGLAPWLIQVLPLPPGRDGPFAGVEGVVLIVTDTEARTAAASARLRQALGLSQAEASLAAALAGGTTLADHARRRGVSVETVRSQMASIRRKTGCRRQAELVALVDAIMR